jgi:hypothetical protein
MDIKAEMWGGKYLNRDGSAVSHAWNRAYLDGAWRWYDVDVEGTVYRRGGKVLYYLYEKGDAEWATTHADMKMSNDSETVSSWLADIPRNGAAIASPTPAPSASSAVTMTILLKIGEKDYTKNGVTAQFDVAPYVDPGNGRTMVPIRFIAEAFGAQVEWHNDTETDIISLGSKSLSITLGKELPNNMGKSVLIQDRLFVPVRYVSEQLGAAVQWTSNTAPIIITM